MRRLLALSAWLILACTACFPDGPEQAPDGPPPGAHPSALPGPRADGDVIDLGRRPRLRVVAFGDVRPDTPDDPYPAQRVADLYAAAARQAPDVVVFLGDIIYVAPARYDGARTQMLEYLRGRAMFPGAVFHALGNHEAFGGNLRAFREVVQPATYFELGAQTDAGAVKVVFLADNLWDETQAAWARARLSGTTALTVVVRHYPGYNEEYRNGQIAALLRQAQPDLVLCGHTHGFRRPGPREIVAGTGGASPADPSDRVGLVRLDLGAEGTWTAEALGIDGARWERFTIPPP